MPQPPFCFKNRAIMMDSGFIQECFSKIVCYFSNNSDIINKTIRDSIDNQNTYSSEQYLSFCIARAFEGTSIICVRESPYVDFFPTFRQDLGKDALDIQLISSDKMNNILIEAKHIHDFTQDSYRNRDRKYGGSVYGDIEKLKIIPSADGREKFVFAIMTNINIQDNSPDEWLSWLERSMPDDAKTWKFINNSSCPLCTLGDGWLHIAYCPVGADAV